MKEYVDLHLHSTKSDGKFSPSELVEKAVRLGLKAIAITDHDTIAGIEEAQKAAKRRIEVVSGVEISCNEEERGFDEVHVLGYFFNPDSKPLKALLQKARNERINQKKKIIEKLQEFGFEISFDEILELAKGELSRVHVAEILLRNHPEKFSSMQDVFDKYIGNRGPAYVDREYMTSIKEAVDTIKKSGGIAVLGHPGMYNDNNALELIDYFIRCGGQGLEIYYPYEKVYGYQVVTKIEEQRKIAFFKKVSKEKGLVESGGSDFHGNIRDTQINEMKVPYSVFEKLNKLLIHKSSH